MARAMLGLAFFVTFFLPMAVLSQPKIAFEKLEYTMEPVRKGGEARLDIPFRNTGDKPLIITSVKGTGTPTTRYTMVPIFPGQSGVIIFSMPTSFATVTKQRIYVTTNADEKTIELVINLTIYDPERTVSGVVRDTVGMPLPGIEIATDAANQSIVQTDLDGRYSILASPNSKLTFRFVGMKTQTITADKTNIDVIMHETATIHDSYGPGQPTKKSIGPIVVVTAKQIERATDAKRNFRKNKKLGVFVLYVQDANALAQRDLDFQKKFKITYSSDPGNNREYKLKNNGLVFRHLSKTFGKTWRSEVRRDAFGVEKL